MSVRQLVVITILLWGSTPLFEKLALSGSPPFVFLFLRTVFIALCMGGIVLATGEIRQGVQLSGRTVLFTLLSALFGGVLGLSVYFHALQRGEASIVVPVTSSYPLVTVLMSFLVLGEPITVSKTAGAALIVAGLMLLR